jgi:hypothetical protein
MFKIWALVIEDDEYQDTVLYWRRKDIEEDFLCIAEELVDTAVAAKVAEMDLEKAIRFLNKQTDIEFSIAEVPIEGSVDGLMLKKLEKLCEGPHEVKSTIRLKPKAATKVAAVGGCRMVIDGVEV